MTTFAASAESNLPQRSGVLEALRRQRFSRRGEDAVRRRQAATQAALAILSTMPDLDMRVLHGARVALAIGQLALASPDLQPGEEAAFALAEIERRRRELVPVSSDDRLFFGADPSESYRWCVGEAAWHILDNDPEQRRLSPAAAVHIGDLATADPELVDSYRRPADFVRAVLGFQNRVVDGVHLGNVWLDRIEDFMLQGYPLRVEARNPGIEDLDALVGLMRLNPGRTELNVVIDDNYRAYGRKSPDKIRFEILSRLRRFIPEAEEGRDVRVIFSGSRREQENLAIAGVSMMLDRYPHLLHVDEEGVHLRAPERLITLLDAQLNPTNVALEASRLAPQVNAHIVHLIFSKENQRSFRDDVWRVAPLMCEDPLPIEHQLLHEVFGESGLPLAHDVSTLTTLLQEEHEKGRQEPLAGPRERAVSHFGIDTKVAEIREYAVRNYGSLLPIDLLLINLYAHFLWAEHQEGRLPLGSIERIEDISGPLNRNTLLAWVPYLAPNALVEATDFNPDIRRLQEWYARGEPEDDPDFGPLHGMFRASEKLLEKISPIYEGCYDALRKMFSEQVTGGAGYVDLMSLTDSEEQGARVSGFVADSITRRPELHALATYNSIVRTAHGGRGIHFFVGNSLQYNMGDAIFGAANLSSAKDLEALLGRMVGPENVRVTFVAEKEGEPTFRTGYHGAFMASVTIPPEGLAPFSEVINLSGRVEALRRRQSASSQAA